MSSVLCICNEFSASVMLRGNPPTLKSISRSWDDLWCRQHCVHNSIKMPIYCAV